MKDHVEGRRMPWILQDVFGLQEECQIVDMKRLVQERQEDQTGHHDPWEGDEQAAKDGQSPR